MRERQREREREKAVQSWSRAQCRGGGKCQQRTPPTLSTLRACGVSLVDVVSAGVGEVEREQERQLEEWIEEESENDLPVVQGNIQRRGKGREFRLEA